MKVRLFAGLVTLMALNLGCFFGSSEEPTAAPTSADMAVVRGGGSGPALIIRNQTSQTVCYIYLSPNSSDQWGPDQLDSDEVLAPGQAVGWRVAADTYDVKFEDCNGNELIDYRGIPVTGDGIVLTYQ